jgi:hypothetical protein
MRDDGGFSYGDHPSMRTIARQLGKRGGREQNTQTRCEGTLIRNEEITHPGEPAFSLEDFETEKIVPNPGWLKEVWGKWPGDESIEELLAALKGC